MGRASTDSPTVRRPAHGAAHLPIGQSAAAREPAGGRRREGDGAIGSPAARRHRRRAGAGHGDVVLGVGGRPRAARRVAADRGWRRVADGGGPARLRHRRRDGGRAEPRRPCASAPAGRRVRAPRGRRDGLCRRLRRRPRGGGAAAVPHRRGPRRGLPDRPQAHDVVVRPWTRLRPRRAGRRPDAGQRAPPADQRLRRAAVAGGAAGGSGERRGGRAARGAGRPPRPAGRARPAVPAPVRADPVPRAGAAPGQPRLLRAHVGAVRHVDVAPRLPGREHRDDRCAAARRSRRLPRDRCRGGRRVPARRLAGRPGRAGAAGGAGDGGERHLLRAGRVRLRRPTASWCWRWCSSGVQP